MTELQHAALRKARVRPIPGISPVGIGTSPDRIDVGFAALLALALRRSPAVAGALPGAAVPTASGA